jgi:ABC-type multidrug transport system ATPase subunit
VNGDAAVRIRGVAKAFGDVRALDGVTLEVPARTIFGLVGPNGAGKTTLFSVIANFLKADAGEIEVLGVDVRRISLLQGRLAILPQDALFQRNVPIVEQLAFFRQLDGKARREAEEDARRTLERVGLGPYVGRRVHALSHGMVKRLGLAQAFLGEPEVILLDEPTSGLDPQNARQIRDLIREFHARATIVVSSHNLAEVQELCSHVAILDQGRLVAAGPVAEVTRTGRRVEFRPPRPLTPDEVSRLKTTRGIADLSGPNAAERYVAALDPSFADADETVKALLRALLDLGLTPRYFAEGSSLEEVFLKVTGRHGPN